MQSIPKLRTCGRFELLSRLRWRSIHLFRSFHLFLFPRLLSFVVSMSLLHSSLLIFDMLSFLSLLHLPCLCQHSAWRISITSDTGTLSASVTMSKNDSSSNAGGPPVLVCLKLQGGWVACGSPRGWETDWQGQQVLAAALPCAQQHLSPSPSMAFLQAGKYLNIATFHRHDSVWFADRNPHSWAGPGAHWRAPPRQADCPTPAGAAAAPCAACSRSARTRRALGTRRCL